MKARTTGGDGTTDSPVLNQNSRPDPGSNKSSGWRIRIPSEGRGGIGRPDRDHVSDDPALTVN